ncbi:MAG: hypothetical protein UU76_C0002G0025 [Parcubacteria group bacterium GW2011_GWC1_41_7]|nr:MAG: hypothetical protein UU76_C0002G0025 [Parcubacteria group bacterium GW2011_GWC1_41_7]
MKKSLFIWLLGIALFAGALFIGTLPASAASFAGNMMGGRGMYAGMSFVQSQTDRSTIESALLKGDYEAWKTAMQSGNQKAVSAITQEQFSAMAKRVQDMQAKRLAVDTAIKNKDYDAWKNAVGTQSPMTQKITASNFNRFVQMQELLQQAQVIGQELGVGPGIGMAGPMHFGFGR